MTARTERIRRIFVSYRQKESGGYVDNLVARLRAEFEPGILSRDLNYLDPSLVFRDIDDDPTELSFKKWLDGAISEAAVILIVIGPTWATITRQGSATPRIAEEDDAVRFEVNCAKREHEAGGKVLTVLVGGARAPEGDELERLPEDVRWLFANDPLKRRPESYELRSGKYWESDFNLLAQQIRIPLKLARAKWGRERFAPAIQAFLLVSASCMSLAAVVRSLVPLFAPTTTATILMIGILGLLGFCARWIGLRILPVRIAMKTRSVRAMTAAAAILLLAMFAYHVADPLQLEYGAGTKDQHLATVQALCQGDWRTIDVSSSADSKAKSCLELAPTLRGMIRVRPGLSGLGGRLCVVAQDSAIDALLVPGTNATDIDPNVVAARSLIQFDLSKHTEGAFKVPFHLTSLEEASVSATIYWPSMPLLLISRAHYPANSSTGGIRCDTSF